MREDRRDWRLTQWGSDWTDKGQCGLSGSGVEPLKSGCCRLRAESLRSRVFLSIATVWKSGGMDRTFLRRICRLDLVTFECLS